MGPAIDESQLTPEQAFSRGFQKLCEILSDAQPILGQELERLARERGELAIARDSLNRNRPNKSLDILANLGLEDFTFEALALQQQSLFTSRQRRTAKTRLKSLP